MALTLLTIEVFGNLNKIKLISSLIFFQINRQARENELFCSQKKQLEDWILENKNNNILRYPEWGSYDKAKRDKLYKTKVKPHRQKISAKYDQIFRGLCYNLITRYKNEIVEIVTHNNYPPLNDSHLVADAYATENCVCDGRQQHIPEVQIPEDVAYPNENMEVEVEVEENPVQQEVEVEENLSNEQRLLIRHLKSKINNRLFLYRHLITFDLNDLDTRSRQSYEVVRSAVQCFNLSGSYTKEEVISSYRRLA